MNTPSLPLLPLGIKVLGVQVEAAKNMEKLAKAYYKEIMVVIDGWLIPLETKANTILHEDTDGNNRLISMQCIVLIQ